MKNAETRLLIETYSSVISLNIGTVFTFLQFKQLSLLHFKAKIAKMLSTWDVLIREYFCIVIEFLTGSRSDTDPSGFLLLQRLKQLTCFLQVSLRLQCLWVSCSRLGSRRMKNIGAILSGVRE